MRRTRDEHEGVLTPEDLMNLPHIVLSLGEAVQLPSREELASRWPGHSEEQLDALARDYQSERHRLEALDLGPIIQRIKELAVQELEGGLEIDDVDMGA